MSGYRYELEPAMKEKLLERIHMQEYTEYKIPNIPSLAFSIACFFDEDMNERVSETIEKVSQAYCKRLKMIDGSG